MSEGNYEEAIASLSFQFTYGTEGADKYANYTLGNFGLYGLFPSGRMQYWGKHLGTGHYVDKSLTYWSQEKIAKEFLILSAKAGFSPAMMQLANITGEYKWVVKAASYGNSEAIRLIKNNNDTLPEIVITNEVIQKDARKGYEIDTRFKKHNPVLAARRNKERLKRIKALWKDTLTIAVTAQLKDSGNSSSSDSAVSCNTNSGSGIDYDCYQKQMRILGEKRGEAEGKLALHQSAIQQDAHARK